MGAGAKERMAISIHERGLITGAENTPDRKDTFDCKCSIFPYEIICSSTNKLRISASHAIVWPRMHSYDMGSLMAESTTRCKDGK